MSLAASTNATHKYGRLTTLLFVILGAACAHDVVAPPMRMSASSSVQRENLIISTEKPFGPVPGSFTTSGAFVESGVLLTERRIVSAIPSPFGVVTHLTLLFVGQQGTFTIRTQIIESVSGDESIFTNAGTWVIVAGTGAYATLRGSGEMEGTADDSANLITRVYTGLVFFK